MQPPPTFDTPPAQVTPVGDRRGLAIASLVLGILSLCSSIVWFCSAPLAVIGIILGVLSLKSSARQLALIGIILSVIGLVLTIIITIFVGTNYGSIMQQLQQMQMTLQPTP